MGKLSVRKGDLRPNADPCAISAKTIDRSNRPMGKIKVTTVS
jgi:hypothetical protein